MYCDDSRNVTGGECLHLQVLGEGDDTQLSLSWRTLDEKRKETDVCMGCGTFQLNDKVGGLVEKLVGIEEEVVVKEEPPKKVEPVVVETPKSDSKGCSRTCRSENRKG